MLSTRQRLPRRMAGARGGHCCRRRPVDRRSRMHARRDAARALHARSAGSTLGSACLRALAQQLRASAAAALLGKAAAPVALRPRACCCARARAPRRQRIASARLWPAQEYTRVIARVTAPTRASAHSCCARPAERLVLDLEGVELDRELAELVAQGRGRPIRTSQRSASARTGRSVVRARARPQGRGEAAGVRADAGGASTGIAWCSTSIR